MAGGKHIAATSVNHIRCLDSRIWIASVFGPYYDTPGSKDQIQGLSLSWALLSDKTHWC